MPLQLATATSRLCVVTHHGLLQVFASTQDCRTADVAFAISHQANSRVLPDDRAAQRSAAERSVVRPTIVGAAETVTLPLTPFLRAAFRV